MNSFKRLFKDFLDYQNILFPEQLFMGHSWQRVPNTPRVMKTPLYCPPTFLKFRPTPLSVASNLHPPAIFDVLFLWLNGWPCHIWCFISRNDIMDLQMLSLGTSLPERPCRNELFFLGKYYMLTSSKLRFHWMYLTFCRK